MPDFPVPISERAERGIRWLEKHAPGRFQGWCLDAEGVFAVDLLKPGGEAGCFRFLGDSLEDALKRAVDSVRGAAGAAAAIRFNRPAPGRVVAVARSGEPAAFALARALEVLDP